MHNPDHENGLARPSPAFLVSAPRSAPAALARHPRKTPRLAPARSRSASIGAPGWRWGQSRANPLANVHDSPLHTPASLMVREDPGSAPFWPSSAPGSRGHQPNATARIDDEPSSLIRTGTTTGGRSRPLGAGHTGIGCGSAMTSRLAAAWVAVGAARANPLANVHDSPLHTPASRADRLSPTPLRRAQLSHKNWARAGADPR